jgi:hypothetical protein
MAIHAGAAPDRPLFGLYREFIMALEKELQTYCDKRSELLAHEGKFVLIHADEISGIWDTYEDALKVGYDKYGLLPFLVKRIEAMDTVNYSTRYTPCRS